MLVNFYRIISSEGEEEYIGSTIRTLQQRWVQHKSEFNTGNTTCNSHIIFKKHGIDTCRIELIETCECETDCERKSQEAELIRASLKCVNKCIPGRTQDEWYAENQEHVITRDKAYHEAHKDERNAYNREYYQLHKDEKKAYNRAYWERRRLAKLTPPPSTA